MDDRVGELPCGDLLIDGDRIADIGPSLQVDAADVIDATGRIVMPGLVNAHIHLWQRKSVV